MTDIDSIICQMADPETAQRRFDDLVSGKEFQSNVNKLSSAQIRGLCAVLGYSDFLSNYIRRFPDSVLSIGEDYTSIADDSMSPEEIRRYKYSELFKLTVRDLMNQEPYESILRDTSLLAEEIIRKAYRHLAPEFRDFPGFCILGMGKLGAMELNYSSDIDLIFVCKDLEKNEAEYLELMISNIRKFTSLMEEFTSDGFLYRVDLKLRPWGRSGPLVLSIDDTENYYSASTEAWERFIWLRARTIAGDTGIGEKLLQRLEPFVYRKSLSDDDLKRFLEIKSEMQIQHRKAGNWNVKQGSGGIRDIEFFIQLLQIVNAYDHQDLKTTNTLDALEALCKKGFIQDKDASQIRESYLFLRRLENHLQMIDERQTHQLPDDQAKRLPIARSMLVGTDIENAQEIFEEQLGLHQATARNCFERILPETHLLH